MKHRSRWLAGLAAIALAVITTTTAFGMWARSLRQ